ncbi:hypothetical protein HK102_002702 [Quaeritorhiza haematococci]|nr:hypothetical protein HK102_002702 [Quaeritorhiza haematococci]
MERCKENLNRETAKLRSLKDELETAQISRKLMRDSWFKEGTQVLRDKVRVFDEQILDLEVDIYQCEEDVKRLEGSEERKALTKRLEEMRDNIAEANQNNATILKNLKRSTLDMENLIRYSRKTAQHSCDGRKRWTGANLAIFASKIKALVTEIQSKGGATIDVSPFQSFALDIAISSTRAAIIRAPILRTAPPNCSTDIE